MAVIILAVGVAPALARGLTSSSTVLTSIILIPIALASIGFPLGWTIMAFEPKDEQISKEIVYRQR